MTNKAWTYYYKNVESYKTVKLFSYFYAIINIPKQHCLKKYPIIYAYRWGKFSRGTMYTCLYIETTLPLLLDSVHICVPTFCTHLSIPDIFVE